MTPGAPTDSTSSPAAPVQPPCAAAAAPAPWRCHGPWEDLAEWVKAEAQKVQAALLPVLERWDNSLATHAELERIAAENWRRHFGKTISARHLRRLIARTIARDAGRQEWTRRDLYVRENPPRQPAGRAELPREDEPLADVHEVLLGFATPAEPTPNELAMLWLAAWRWYQDALGAGRRPKAAKAHLLAFLSRRAAWLSPNRHALAEMVSRAFRKLAHAAGAAIAAEDGRRTEAARAARRAPEIPIADIITIAAYATHCTGNRLAQAERELVDLRETSGISTATLDVMDAGASKTHVNRRLAGAVQPFIRAAAPYILGKKAVDDATPAIIRDYSKLRVLQVVTADDFTMPVYFWIKDAQGHPVTDPKGRPVLTRGQVLLFIDVRSLKIISWVLIPERNYTGLQVRTGMNTVCLEQGRPDVWLFECGVWKQSNLVQGKPPRDWRLANPSFTDTAYGWEKLGVRFIHAKRARSKPAELVGGKLQNFMERCPGYCGRNEREDCPEETKRAKLAVDAGREHPSAHFYSFDQWESVLGGLIDRYNADPQEGRILDGRSPAQVFEALWPHENPPVKFDPACWHLCAHYQRECEVKAGGVSFTIGKETFTYYDKAFGAFVHRRVLAWFDPGHPEVLCITDLEQRNPFFVQRATPTDFLATINPDSAEAEHYRGELAKQAGFTKHARAVYRSVKVEFERTFRQNIVPRPTAALGQEMLTKRKEAVAEAGAEDNQRARIIRKARDLGVPVATLRDFNEEVEAALDRRLKRRALMDKEQTE